MPHSNDKALRRMQRRHKVPLDNDRQAGFSGEWDIPPVNPNGNASMGLWNRVFGKKSREAPPGDAVQLTGDAVQMKRRLESHPNSKLYKRMLNDFGGSGMSGDEVLDTLATVMAESEAERKKTK